MGRFRSAYKPLPTFQRIWVFGVVFVHDYDIFGTKPPPCLFIYFVIAPVFCYRRHIPIGAPNGGKCHIVTLRFKCRVNVPYISDPSLVAAPDDLESTRKSSPTL